ncbi:site-specific DNA-methyltransferase [Mediterraneibacter sp. NSJ-55]|uniref:Methyltransferase n=1 Tax=Mediterraneibacter hominis TaxID=2763054 RepID=A0A923RP73_9FIRM|nr:site-specific DNA-methyltransferase [Mediterraneibacter hominis]MBC5688111.1 site-specific DNA-methyltransferase [Mediterraneibacter hominis]
MKVKNTWINGDCLKELKKMDDGCVDLIITSPPYHNLRVYSNDPSDLSNCESYEEYYYLLGLVIAECQRVLKPGGKFCMQYEDYNYTIGRDGRRGKESITGAINKMFTDNGFCLWSEICWEKYTPQRAMISDGSLWYRNLKVRDTIIAANFGYVYVYKKSTDGLMSRESGSDITLEEWATWASGVWKIPNSSIGGANHMTPFAYELCRRLIKLYSCPGDTILDPFAGSGTCNRAAIENHRNAIGIELKKEFYDAAQEIFNKWDEAVFESDDSYEKMLERFKEQLQIGELNKEKGKAEKEEMKEMRDRKKELCAEIKLLEAQLNELGMKKSEIKKLKDSVGDVID